MRSVTAAEGSVFSAWKDSGYTDAFRIPVRVPASQSETLDWVSYGRARPDRALFSMCKSDFLIGLVWEEGRTDQHACVLKPAPWLMRRLSCPLNRGG